MITETQPTVIVLQLTDEQLAQLHPFMTGLGISVSPHAACSALDYAEESRAVFDALNEPYGRVYPLYLLVNTAQIQGDVEQAAVYAEELLRFYQQIGYQRGIALALMNQGVNAQLQGDWEQAATCYADGLAIFRDMDDKAFMAAGLTNLGAVLLHQGKIRCAATHITEGLILSREIGSPDGLLFGLAGMAGVMAAQSQSERAARWFGTMDAVVEQMGVAVHPLDQREYDRNREIAKAQLGEERFASAWNLGWMISLEEAIDEAMSSQDAATATQS